MSSMKTSPEKRDKLKTLTAILARIHKALMELQMNDLQAVSGIEIKPAARLNLLLGDPSFAWLRNLSQLMAIADDVYFQKEIIQCIIFHREKNLQPLLLKLQKQSNLNEQ